MSLERSIKVRGGGVSLERTIEVRGGVCPLREPLR